MKLTNPFTKKKKEVINVKENVTIETKPSEVFVKAEYTLELNEKDLIALYRAKYGIGDDFELSVYFYSHTPYMYQEKNPTIGVLRANQRVKLEKDEA